MSRLDWFGGFDLVVTGQPFLLVSSQNPNINTITEFWYKIDQLERKVPIWPSWREQQVHDRKIDLESDLDHILQTAKSLRPTVVADIRNDADIRWLPKELIRCPSRKVSLSTEQLSYQCFHLFSGTFKSTMTLLVIAVKFLSSVVGADTILSRWLMVTMVGADNSSLEEIRGSVRTLLPLKNVSSSDNLVLMNPAVNKLSEGEKGVKELDKFVKTTLQTLIKLKSYA
ncbi:hypothetical protein Hypma_005587 [Hypsizygus marmoreus]|uniref:Uncharacterized protein n=1 Tax=Hypsizygus marmoreus TaxID=39966 RepID=A0A369K4A1_HYPMA|nr:hypothetical protein Hypma_005587 [Hypsizygus marmoreus]